MPRTRSWTLPTIGTIVLLCLTALSVQAATATASESRQVVTDDIPRFWQAFGQIRETDSRTKQAEILKRVYIDPGSAGLHAMMARRNYSVDDYLDAINHYPRFFASVRANTLNANQYAADIEAGLAKLRALYPEAKPATVTFTIGALMSGGTTLNDQVLIGAEIAMADQSAVTDELPEPLAGNLRRYFDTNPIQNLALLNVHEYVHTQQGAFGSNLLAVSLQEGVAEFVSTKAMGRPSTSPALAYGAGHAKPVRERFAAEMFSPNWDDWLYNDADNTFGIRDLGYYVGDAIARAYFEQHSDPAAAIRELIALDFQDAEAVRKLVDQSGYFPEPLSALAERYRAQQPRVLAVTGLNEASRQAAPALITITIQFSAPMNPRYRGFDVGPLGEANVLRVEAVEGWSADHTELRLKVRVNAAQVQQLVLSSGSRAAGGPALEPYLIEYSP